MPTSARTASALDLHGLTLNVTKHIESQTREQKYGMEHIAIDADDIQGMIDMLKANGATILEEATVSGDRRVVFFEGPDGVQLEFIEKEVGTPSPQPSPGGRGSIL